MRYFRTAISVLLVTAAIFTAPIHAEDSLKGNWKAVSVKCSGANCEVAKGLQCRITDDSISAKYGETTIMVGYRLFQEDGVEQISVMVGELAAWKGIYAVDRNQLTLCVVQADGKLPDELTTKDGDGRVLVTLERGE